MNEEDRQPIIRADRFFLAQAPHQCWSCKHQHQVGMLFVVDYTEECEYPEDAYLDKSSPAGLGYIERINEQAMVACQAILPTMRFAQSKTYGEAYFCNCCPSCGKLQGDHFVQGPEGPFWPYNESRIAPGVSVVSIECPIEVACSPSQSSRLDPLPTLTSQP